MVENLKGMFFIIVKKRTRRLEVEDFTTQSLFVSTVHPRKLGYYPCKDVLFVVCTHQSSWINL